MSFPRYQLSGEAKAPGGSVLQEAVSSKLDALFAEYLALYAEVRSERAAASACLKDGFFALSQARHAMPAGGAAAVALDSSAYSGRDMQPTIGWACRSVHAAAGEASKDPKAVEAPVLFTVAPVEYKDAEDEDDDEDEYDFAATEEKGDGVRKRGGKAAAAASSDEKAASESSSSASASSSSSPDAAVAPAPLDLRSSPLQWFGVLAPSSQLSSVAASFRSSLGPLARVATLAQNLQEIENKFKYLSHLQQASHVDPNAEDELAQILEKIKISDEKKKAAAAATTATITTTKSEATAAAATPAAETEAAAAPADKQ